MTSSVSEYCSVSSFGGSTYCVGGNNGKVVRGTNTYHPVSHKVGCCIDGGTFVSSQSRYY